MAPSLDDEEDRGIAARTALADLLGTAGGTPGRPELVGRDGELAALRDSLRRASGGELRVVLVAGEAGAGKTALLEEFLAVARNRGATTALGRCLETGADALPYTPVFGVLRDLRRALGREFDAAANQAGEAPGVLPAAGGERAVSHDSLRERPTDEYRGAEHRQSSLPAEDARSRLRAAVATLLETLVRSRRPLVVAVEDLHSADRSSLDLLMHLIHRLHAAPLLLVATLSTDDLHRRHRLGTYLAEFEKLGTAERIDLPRFARPEVRRRVSALTGAAEPEPRLVERIHERSGGNALLVEELALAQSASAPLRPGHSMPDILLARIDALPDPVRRLVRTAAGGGPRVEHALLARVTGLSDDALLPAVRAAVRAGVLVPEAQDVPRVPARERPDAGGGAGTDPGDDARVLAYRFRHALVREAVLDDLLPGARGRFGRSYALALEADPALVAADERVGRLADYWHCAKDPVRSLPHLLAAAREAGRIGAFAERLLMLERALETCEGVDDDELAKLPAHEPADPSYPPPWDTAGGFGDAGLHVVDILADVTTAAVALGEHGLSARYAETAIGLLDESAGPERAAWFLSRCVRATGLTILDPPAGRSGQAPLGGAGSVQRDVP